MRLGTKIITAAVGAVAVSVTVGLLVQRHIIHEQGIELTHGTMRAVVIEAESVRESVSQLNRQNAFDRKQLIEEYKKSGDLRGSTLYQTIPVVAAWKAIEKAAEKEGFEFRVPKHQARNAKNNPTSDEEQILQELEQGKAPEYFKVDTANNQIVYARPIILSADCLACHGDPKNSPSGDGKDLAGFAMENWRAGEIHGAFVLKSKLDHVDQVVKAGTAQTMMWMFPIAALIGAGFFFLYRWLIARPLNHAIAQIELSSAQTANASGEVSAASQSLAEGASEQAAALEQTSASLEEIASMTRLNAEHAQTAKDLANQTRHAAETGASDMNAMTTAVAEIKAASDNISKILKTIDEIAFQTNILALNAAVEAARVGEAGMGFAVVADEVRNLAQRSAQAARETADKIEDSIRKSENGVQISGKVGSSLREIVEKARRVDELIAQIASASKEQTQGISQVNSAVSQMDKVTQANAAGAEESAAAAQELSAHANTLKQSVGALQDLVGSQGAVGQSSNVVSKVGKAPTTKKDLLRSRIEAGGTLPNNGHASQRKNSPIPMEGDFKDF